MPSPPPTLCHSQHIQKPLHQVYDIMSGEGAAALSMPKPCTDAYDPEMPGLLPCEEVLDDNNVGGAWSILDGETVHLKDFERFEEALLAETSDTEALKPQMPWKPSVGQTGHCGRRPSKRS